MFLVGLTWFLFLGIVSCAKKAPSGEEKPLKFGVSYLTLNNPYFIELNEALEAGLAEFGGQLVTFDGQFNISKQVADVEDMVQSGCDLIFLNPIDWKGIKPALEYARERNVPIIVVDTPVFDDDLVLSTVASDNYKAGVLCAQAVIEAKPNGANIGIIEMSVDKSAQDRADGFKDTIADKIEYKILNIQDGDGGEEKALLVAENMITGFPEIDVIFGINDPTAIGAVAALQSAGRKNVLVLGVDGSEDAIEMIKEGLVYATAAQFPREIGRIAAESAKKYLIDKQNIEHDIAVDVELIK
jgi:ribose transport system substrate-binding protein